MEIYLANQNGKEFQFIVSAGALWDAEIVDVHTRNIKWDSGAVSAVKINGNRICMEIAIPKTAIGVADGVSLKANLYRSRVVDEGQTFAAWSPIFEERHYKPERYGTIILK